MSFNGSLIYEAEVLTSNPATHSVRVRLLVSSDDDPVECCVLMPHGNSTGDAHLLSMPSVGQQVLILLDSNRNGVVLGTLPKASLSAEPSSSITDLDPLSHRFRDTNYRGEDEADIMPGDLSIRSKNSRITVGDDGLSISSGSAVLELDEVMGGYSHLHSAASSVSHKNRLLSYKVIDPGLGVPASLELEAFTQDSEGQTPLGDLGWGMAIPDTTISMNSETPFSLKYDDTSAITVDSKGNLLLRGKTVTIDTDGQVHEFGKTAKLQNKYEEDISLETSSSASLKATGSLTLSGGSTYLRGENTLSMGSANGSLSITAGGTSKSSPLPGLDQTLAIRASNGAVSINSGSLVPGPGSATKPGIRLQSDGGGDVHISSVPSLGGAFTTGSVVVDSAIPVSSARSGGLGNYGIVLNSPLVLVGGIPGVPDTPAGVPGPFGAPIPPVYDSFVKHFTFMTVYAPLLTASVSAGIAAAFPPTAKVSVEAFVSPFSTALAAMATPVVGRPLTMVGIG